MSLSNPHDQMSNATVWSANQALQFLLEAADHPKGQIVQDSIEAACSKISEIHNGEKTLADLLVTLETMRDVLGVTESSTVNQAPNYPLHIIRQILAGIPPKYRASQIMAAMETSRLELDPLSIDLHAEALEVEGRPSDARALILHAIEISDRTKQPKTWAYGLLFERLGRLFLEDREIDQARKAFEKALSLHPLLSATMKALADIVRPQDPHKASALLLQSYQIPAMPDQRHQEDDATLYNVGIGPFGRSIFMHRGYFFARLYRSPIPLKIRLRKAVQALPQKNRFWPASLIADVELPSLKWRINRLIPKSRQS